MPKLFRLIAALVFFSIAAAYLSCAPTTVQNLDSGEMVANSYGLFVLHPPGYPLFTWILFLITHIPLGTVFFRASVFTIACSLTTLWLVFKIAMGEKSSIAAFAAALALTFTLAFTPVYWRYSVLPDVFMLHLLFCVLLSYLYIARPVSNHRLWQMALVFGLASAHHQTILFCAPLLVHAALQTWRLHRSIRGVFAALGVGACLTIFMYSTLLCLHTDSLQSWGHLQSLADVGSHFLRKDFGTFQISGRQSSDFAWAPLKDFAAEILKTNFALFLLLPLAVWKFRRRESRDQISLIIIAFCFCLSVFALIPFATLDGGLTTERFFLMPLTLGAVVVAVIWRGLQTSHGQAVVFAFGILTISVSHLVTQTNELNYSHDTVIEDYAQNLLRMVEGQPKSVIITNSDTRLFSLRYAQVVQGLSAHVLLVPLGMAFSEPQLEKMRVHAPDFKVDHDWQTGPHARSVVEHIIKPNLQAYTFLTSIRVNQPEMRTVFMGLGRKLSIGRGDGVDESSLPRIRMRTRMENEAPSLQPLEKRDLFSEYAFAYLKLGMLAHDPHQQIAAFEKALALVPYCWPALANICVIHEKLSEKLDTDCRQRLAALKASEFNYY